MTMMMRANNYVTLILPITITKAFHTLTYLNLRTAL